MKASQQKPVRVFFDLDGTLAEWHSISSYKELLKKGYFINLAPYNNVVQAAAILSGIKGVDVYILSAVPQSEYAIEEKKAWVRKNLPNIEENHMIFSKEGRDKRDFIPGGFRPTDVLIDDYSANLHAWAKTCCGIKLLNGINHTKKTWQGPCISRFASGKEIANEILSIHMAEYPV